MMRRIVGIGIGRGRWVGALVAVGCTVLVVDLLQAARRYRERPAVLGVESGAGGARVLADMVRAGSGGPPW